MFRKQCEHCREAFHSKHRNARFCGRACSTLSRTHRPPIDPGDGTAIVPLTKGKVAVIDADDIECVSLHTWHCLRNGYAYNHDAGYLHRYLVNPPPGMEVDHADGDRLNCRRSNLRVCTVAENRRNRRPMREGRKGVSFHKASQRYHARIRHNGKTLSLGYYATPEEAAQAYDNAARQYHGTFARVNTP